MYMLCVCAGNIVKPRLWLSEVRQHRPIHTYTHNSYIISGRRGGCSSSRLYARRVVHNARVLSQQVCHTSRASSLSDPKNQCRPPRQHTNPAVHTHMHGRTATATTTTTTTTTDKPVFDLYGGGGGDDHRRRDGARRVKAAIVVGALAATKSAALARVCVSSAAEAAAPPVTGGPLSSANYPPCL